MVMTACTRSPLLYGVAVFQRLFVIDQAFEQRGRHLAEFVILALDENLVAHASGR